MIQKGVLFYNPKSGKGKGEAKARIFADLWNKNLTYELELFPTQSLEHLQESVAKLDFKTTIPMFMGGDGTLSEGLEIIFEVHDFQKLEFPVGFLPAGSGNSFLEDFGLSQFDNASQALVKAIKDKEFMAVDALLLQFGENGEQKRKTVINIWGLGLVSHIAALAMKMRYFGKWNYTWATLIQTFLFHKPSRFGKIEDENESEVKIDTLAICNSRYTGGKMKMAPKVRVNDGKMHLIQASIFSKLKILKFFPRIFKGTHILMPGVSQRILGNTIGFEDSQPMLMLVDGEVMSGENPTLEMMPSSWLLYMPKEQQHYASLEQ